MSLNQPQDPSIRSGVARNAPGPFLRAMTLGVFALSLAALVQPAPALGQWDSVAGAVAGAMVRGMVGGGGGGGGGYYYSGGRRHYGHSGRSHGHVAHSYATGRSHAAPVHHASSGGHHAAASSGGAPSGPGGGSLH